MYKLFLTLTTLLLGGSGFRSLLDIPKCYTTFPGITPYSYSDVNRKSIWSNKTTSFYVTAKKKVTVGIADQYDITYSTIVGQPFIEVSIQLSDTKKFKQYKIDQFKVISEHHISKHNEEGLVEFELNSFKFYGFNAKDISSSTLGTYISFPTEKMLISFKFKNLTPENRNFDSLEGYIMERNKFLDAFTKHLLECSKE